MQRFGIALLAGTLTLFAIQPIRAQDTAEAVREARRNLASNITFDTSIVMPDSVPSTAFLFDGGKCTFDFADDSLGNHRLYSERCTKAVDSTASAFLRLRIIDIREGRVRRALFIGLSQLSDGAGSPVLRCKVYFDEGFYNGGEPNGRFLAFTEKVCFESNAKLRELLGRLTP